VKTERGERREREGGRYARGERVRDFLAQRASPFLLLAHHTSHIGLALFTVYFCSQNTS
jgi:hypothetical protein